MQHAQTHLPLWSLGAGILYAFCAWGCGSDSSATAPDGGVTANGGGSAQPDASAAGSGAGDGGGQNSGGGTGGNAGAGGTAVSTEPDAGVVVVDAGLTPQRRACAALCAREVVYNAATPCQGFTEALCFATCTSVIEYAPYIGCDAQHTELLRCQTAADTWLCQPSGATDAGIGNEIVADPAVCPTELAALNSCSL